MVSHGPVQVQSGDTFRSEMPYPPMAGPSAISRVDPISSERNPTQTVPKRRETVVSGPYQVRFGGIPSLPHPAPTDANAIGNMDPISFMDPMDIDTKPSRTVRRGQSTAASGSYRVRFGGVAGLPRPAQTDTNVIGPMEPTDVGANPSGNVGKHPTTVTRGPARVRFGSPPHPEMPPRRSLRVSKAKSRKASTDLFSQLAQGFHTLAKTFEELGEALD